jgi:hypothetical protein
MALVERVGEQDARCARLAIFRRTRRAGEAERDLQVPHITSLKLLCEFYRKTPEELGFGQPPTCCLMIYLAFRSL